MKTDLTIKEWIHEHKTELIVGGIAALCGTTVVVANWDSIKGFFRATPRTLPTKSKVPTPKKVPDAPTPTILNEAAKAVESISAPRKVPQSPVDVSKHLRELPPGKHASAEKVATAAANGFTLREGQTWVISFTKYNAA